jgi:type 1 glutamine amidotransferase
MYKISCFMFISSLVLAMLSVNAKADDNPWIVYEGSDGPGKGMHIVFVSGDDEYRGEEGLPMLAKIMAVHHGFKCTVLFAINPESGVIEPSYQTNIPGLEALKSADLMVALLRFRDLPAEQMQHIVDYTNSGKPIIGMRTSTHAFNIKNAESPFKKYSFNFGADFKGGWGRQVLGETWINHHGAHGRESTRGIVVEDRKDHPIVRGCSPGSIWGDTDVYGVRTLAGDSKPLVYGQVLAGMTPDAKPVEGERAKKNMPMMAVAWTKTYKGESGKVSRIFNTTMGAATDLVAEGSRRMMVNSMFWALEMESVITGKNNVDIVGEYKPSRFGFGKFVKGLKPSDHAIK